MFTVTCHYPTRPDSVHVTDAEGVRMMRAAVALIQPSATLTVTAR